MSTEATPKYVIFDTDMGSDDAVSFEKKKENKRATFLKSIFQWALQMLLKAEKHLKSIKIIAITAVNGNTTMENVIKNTYRILDGLGRTDVSKF